MTHQPTASVGVTEHGNSAVLVTVTSDGELLDRRRVDLTDKDLPTHPYHHEGSWAVGRYQNSPWARKISLTEAIELIERVQISADRGAKESLNSLAAEIPVTITNISIRLCPELPPTIEECIRDNRAQTIADTVMYRKALARAGVARGWKINWYNRDQLFKEAEKKLGGKDITALHLKMGKNIGPPWQAKHKLAAAAALAAAQSAG